MIHLQEEDGMTQMVILHQGEGMIQMRIHHQEEEMIQMVHPQDDVTVTIHHLEERVVGTNLLQNSLIQMYPHQERGLKEVILTFLLQGKGEILIQTFLHQECRKHWMA